MSEETTKPKIEITSLANSLVTELNIPTNEGVISLPKLACISELVTLTQYELVLETDKAIEANNKSPELKLIAEQARINARFADVSQNYWQIIFHDQQDSFINAKRSTQKAYDNAVLNGYNATDLFDAVIKQVGSPRVI
ncbi:MAG: hypothetical protein WC069_01115 [Candidatus Shapirobacteria bacterium]